MLDAIVSEIRVRRGVRFQATHKEISRLDREAVDVSLLVLRGEDNARLARVERRGLGRCFAPRGGLEAHGPCALRGGVRPHRGLPASQGAEEDQVVPQHHGRSGADCCCGWDGERLARGQLGAGLLLGFNRGRREGALGEEPPGNERARLGRGEEEPPRVVEAAVRGGRCEGRVR